MFWKFNVLTSHIDTLLDKEDLTLHEILDEDDVLQECKAQNKRLVEFLVRQDNVDELVNYITQEPSDDTDEKMKYKYPNTACELLTSDVSQITDKVAGDEVLMNKIYSFLEAEVPLNPLLASFFSKVMGLLITRKSDMMLEFLRSKDDFIGHLLRHLGTSAIMDLLLRLITCIESPEIHMQCLNWLSEQHLIPRLVAMIDPEHSEEKHCNASQSLCDIIRLSREQMSQLQEKADADPLLSCVESQETITDLLNHMFNGEKVESVLVNGIAVIQALLEFKRLGFFMLYSPDGGSEPITTLDAERLAHGVNNTVQALIPRLKDFHHILKEPPKQHYLPMITTVQTLNPPFGNTRLQIAKLLTSLLLTKTSAVNVELANQGTLGTLLELCFKYMWNNFLHVQVEQCISTVLSTGNSEEDGEQPTENPLLNQLLTEMKLAEKILEVWEDNDQQQTRSGGHRRGYMGHVTKMANHMTTNLEKGPNSEKIKKYFEDLPKDVRERWDTFVSGSLAELNKQNTVELAGGQNLYSSSEDDDPDFRDIPFPQDTAMQQLQQMTSNFIDQFGFNEENFADQEERVSEKFKGRLSSINFDINTDEITNTATLFEQACSEQVQQFGEHETEEDLWEDKEITFSQSSDSRQNSAAGTIPGHHTVPPAATPDSDEEGETDSTDSEEDLDSPRQIHQVPASSSSPQKPVPDSTTAEKMDIDTHENWSNFDDINMETGSVVIDTIPTAWANPDATGATNSSSSSNWASFNSETAPQVASSTDNNMWADFSSTSGNLNSTAPEPRSSSPVAMETSDIVSNQRTATYLVSSAPADLASDISSLNREIQSSEATSSSSKEDQQNSSSPPCPAPDTTTDISAVTTDGQPPSAPDTSTTTTPTQADSTSPKSLESCADKPSTVTSAMEHEDDLGDNFNFLASSGLMRCSDKASSPTPTSTTCQQAENTPADTDASKNKLEEIRAQAKEALDQYTSATSTSSNSNPPAQNGPV